MPGNILLCTLCLLVNTPVLRSARSRVWSNRPQYPHETSSESMEILPYISSKLAHRTNTMTEKIDEQDKDKLLTLFSNTKNEVDEKMRWLNKLHGYFNATYNGIFEVYSYFRNLKRRFKFLSNLAFNSKRSGWRRHRHRFL